MSSERRKFLKAATGLAGVGILPVPMVMAATGAQYKNPAAPVEARVKDLLGRMTLDEKVAQMQCIWEEKFLVEDSHGEFSAEKAGKVFPNGLGMLGCPSDRQGEYNASGEKNGNGMPVTRDPAQSA